MEKKIAIVQYKRRYHKSPPPKPAPKIESPVRPISAPIPRRAPIPQIRPHLAQMVQPSAAIYAHNNAAKAIATLNVRTALLTEREFHIKSALNEIKQKTSQQEQEREAVKLIQSINPHYYSYDDDDEQ